MTRPRFEIEAEMRDLQAAVRWHEQALAQAERKWPDVLARNGRDIQALEAHGPELIPVWAEQIDTGYALPPEKGGAVNLTPGAEWRMHYPASAAILDRHLALRDAREKSDKELSALQVEIERTRDRVLPPLKGRVQACVDELDELEQRERQAQAEFEYSKLSTIDKLKQWITSGIHPIAPGNGSHKW